MTPFTPYYVAPSEFSDVFDAMDNAGWYFDGAPGDVWGPYDSRDKAATDAARVAE